MEASPIEAQTEAPSFDRTKVLQAYREAGGIAAVACRELEMTFPELVVNLNGPLRQEAAMIRAEMCDLVLGALMKRALGGDPKAVDLYFHAIGRNGAPRQ
jgi:hypothetical protein